MLVAFDVGSLIDLWSGRSTRIRDKWCWVYLHHGRQAGSLLILDHVTTRNRVKVCCSFDIAVPQLTGRFIPGMVDSLNAEISLGTIANVAEAIQWLGYTYLFGELDPTSGRRDADAFSANAKRAFHLRNAA